MDDALNSVEGAIQSDWFKAAHEVTSLGGLGRADDDQYNYSVLSNQDEVYLRQVHHKLAKINTENYKLLLNGEEIPGLEGLRGKELDYALVELEQKNVTRFTDDYFKEHPDANKLEILESVSRATDPTSIWGRMREGFSNHALVEALDSAFGNETYNASNEEHRIRLGKALIDQIRIERRRSEK